MSQDFEKLFSCLKPVETPKNLFAKVISCIREEQQLISLKRQVVFLSIGLICSAIAFVPAFYLINTSLAESGFLNYLSLLFSDFTIIAAYWQNLALSLLETLPVSGLIVISAIMLIFIAILKYLAQDLKIILSSPRLTNIYHS